MTSIGIRNLKNQLSRYVRRAQRGERILVTDHGRVIAELGPPHQGSEGEISRYDALVSAGIIRPALESEAPLTDVAVLHLPRGTAIRLIDEDRAEE